MCEGEICANKWIHRYCAGVPTDHYKLLEESPEPFHCYLCAQRKQATTIEEMKNTISCLTAEIVELRATLRAETTSRTCSNDQALSSACAGTADVSQGEDRPWSEVVRRGRGRGSRRGQGRQRGPPAPSQSKRTSADRRERSDVLGASRKPENKQSSDGQANASPTDKPHHNLIKQKVPVAGARKIWGTMKETSATAVTSTLTKLTSVTNDQVRIKRKYKSVNRNNNRMRWWFVLRGDEDTLVKLESEWEQVRLQTNWKLEPLQVFAEDPEPAENSKSAENSEPAITAAELQDNGSPSIPPNSDESPCISPNSEAFLD